MSSRTWVGATPWTGTLLVKAAAVELISFSPSICVVSSECGREMYWFGSCPGLVLWSVGVFWVPEKVIAISGWLTETQEMELEQREADVDAHFPEVYL